MAAAVDTAVKAFREILLAGGALEGVPTSDALVVGRRAALLVQSATAWREHLGELVDVQGVMRVFWGASAALPDERNLADVTAPAAYAYGVTAELSATADYAMPHAWAQALHSAGFDGIRYHLRHDPSSTLTGIAWFGRAGRRPSPLSGYSRPIPADILLRAAW